MGYTEEKPVEDLTIYRLSGYHQRALTRKELGTLVADFNKRFHFWNLLVRTYIANNARGSYVLYAVKGVCCHEKGQILKEELEEMRLFVTGYETAVRSFVERDKWQW